MPKIIEIVHYGMPRRSGRYPWGSGDDPFQDDSTVLKTISDMKKAGASQVEIAKALGTSTTKLRQKKSNLKDSKRESDRNEALRLKDKGMSNVAIGKRMGRNESSIRALLDPVLHERATITKSTADMLKRHVEKKKFIDVGAGTENHLGISRNRLDNAIALLKDEGYKIHYIKFNQVGTGKPTKMKILSAPDVTTKEVWANRYDIRLVNEYSIDGGRTSRGLKKPVNVGRDRVHVRYAEDGGSSKDGVIELRRGVGDISLGTKKYAQVRIAVNDDLYMKGMAMYSDDIPRGKDIVYNTKKKRGEPDNVVFKETKDDKDNPFGTTVFQKTYKDKHGNDQQSALNIVYEEGKWGEWSKSISSQILSKQPTSLAKKQLDLARAQKEQEFEEIMQLTNPTVKRYLLHRFADSTETDAVDLKAAALPRQSSHVILPITSMKPNEIYAPNFRPGETVVLIRHPHGGKFEIPTLKVNNRNQDAIRLMGNAEDAVGIHPDVAKLLSGADFDGDSVLVIPNKNKAIKTSEPLKSLKDFDPIESYKLPPEAPKMTPRSKQMQMGDVSNLITDMTIKGASESEIARAVKHSMVVIDAEKHHLDYKRSAIEQGIPELKEKYQGRKDAGASTLISRAGSVARVPKRSDIFRISKTGEKVFEETGETYSYYTIKDPKDPTGKRRKKVFVNAKTVVPPGKKVKTELKTDAIPLMLKEKNAFKLSSGTPIETVYGEHANALKAMARKARIEAERTPYSISSPSAKKTYAPQVASLKAQLNEAQKNRPLERQAQLYANSIISAKRKANPDMSAEELKKLKGQTITEARTRIGAGKKKISITDKEWEAIQVGAVSNSVLNQILENTDLQSIKQRATPKSVVSISPGKLATAKAMRSSGHTASEIADALGVSISTLKNAFNS